MVLLEWERLLAAEPQLAGLFADEAERAAWLAEAGSMLDRYFALEDPRRLEPAHRELSVETVLASGLRLRGYIDRLEVAPGGAVRIVDYKTGSAPPAEFGARALFQMRFYALVMWRAQGQIPRRLQLMYLGSGEIVRYEPEESDLLATERKVEALWRAIEWAREGRDWRPRPGPDLRLVCAQAHLPRPRRHPLPLPTLPSPCIPATATPEPAPSAASPLAAAFAPPPPADPVLAGSGPDTSGPSHSGAS